MGKQDGNEEMGKKGGNVESVSLEMVLAGKLSYHSDMVKALQRERQRAKERADLEDFLSLTVLFGTLHNEQTQLTYPTLHSSPSLNYLLSWCHFSVSLLKLIRSVKARLDCLAQMKRAAHHLPQ